MVFSYLSFMIKKRFNDVKVEFFYDGQKGKQGIFGMFKFVVKVVDTFLKCKM